MNVSLLLLLLRTDRSGVVELMEAWFTSSGLAHRDLAAIGDPLPLLLWTDGSGEVELMEAGFMSSGWARQDLAIPNKIHAEMGGHQLVYISGEWLCICCFLDASVGLISFSHLDG